MTFIDEFTQNVESLQIHMPFLLTIIGILWAIHFVNVMMGHRLNLLGILPRNTHSLLGIVFAPWLHGDFPHLLFNSIALFPLMGLVLLSGYQVFLAVSIIVILISGILIWLFGRKGIHVGASAAIMGYWAFLLISAIHHPTGMSVLLGLVSLYYFAGLAFSLVPGEKGVSWEGHLFGAISGVIAAYFYPILLPYLNI